MTRLALLHSPFLGPGSWGRLPEQLRAAGHAVVVVDATDAVTPKDYARTAAVQLDAEPLVLVAHSGAGSLVPMAAARREWGWVTAAAFVDATLPGVPGESRLAGIRRQRPAEAEALARLLYSGGTYPPVDEEPWSTTEVHPRGLAWFAEPLLVPAAGWSELPWAYVQTSAAYAREADVAEGQGRPVERRDLGHLAALNHPEETAAALMVALSQLSSSATRSDS